MSEVMVHIGLHKTASTFLQKRVFAHSFDGTDVDYNPRPVMEALIPIFEYECYSEEWVNAARRRFIQWRDNAGGRRLFLSAESFSQLLYTQNYSKQAQMIEDIFGRVRICVVIRNQYDWLVSVYKETLKSGDYQSFENFVNWDSNRAIFVGEAGRFKSSGLLDVNVRDTDWFALQQAFANVSDDLRVILYEDLRHDMQSQLEWLSDWCGVSLSIDNRLNGRDVNRGISDRSICWLLHYASVKRNLGLRSGYRIRYLANRIRHCDVEAYFARRSAKLSLVKLLKREISRTVSRVSMYRFLQILDPVILKIGTQTSRPDDTCKIRDAILALHQDSNRQLFATLGREMPPTYGCQDQEIIQ